MNDKMTKEAFNAILDNIETQARANVKSGELIAAHSNRSLDRVASMDPELARLLRQGIADRAANSQRVLDHIRTRREKSGDSK
jgi:hypothetical protein